MFSRAFVCSQEVGAWSGCPWAGGWCLVRGESPICQSGVSKWETPSNMGTRSMCGQCTFYWNAYLFTDIFLAHAIMNSLLSLISSSVGYSPTVLKIEIPNFRNKTTDAPNPDAH